MIWSIICLSFLVSFWWSKIQSTVLATIIEPDNIFASNWEERSKLQVDYNISIHELMESLLEKHRDYLLAHQINASVTELNEHSKIDDANEKDIDVSPKQSKNHESNEPNFQLIPVNRKAVERAEDNLQQKYPNFNGLDSIVPWKENMEAMLIVYNNE